MTKRLAAIVAVALMIALAATGCSSKVHGPWIQVEADSADQLNRLVDAYESGDTDALHAVKAKDLRGDDSDVARLIREATGFISAAYVVDYRTTKGDETIEYLSQTLVQRYVAEGGAKAVLEEARAYKLTTTGDIEPVSVLINADRTIARVDGTLYSTYTSATQTLLDKLGIELGIEYTRSCTVWLVRQDDIWKVDGFELGPLSH